MSNVENISSRSATVNETIYMDLNATGAQEITEGGDANAGWSAPAKLRYEIVLAYVFFVIIAGGLLLNALVIYIVVRHRDMHRVTNFFFANLALTDFLLLFVHATTTSLEQLGYKVSVYVGCTTVQYTRFVIAQVTCLTVALMSYDRHQVVVHPLRSLNSKKRLRWMLGAIVAIWIASFALHLPVAIFAVDLWGLFCSIVFSWKYGAKLFFTYTVVVLYVLPLAVATGCYILIWLHLRRTSSSGAMRQALDQRVRARRMRRVLRTLIVVVSMFAVGWFGENLFVLLIVWDPNMNVFTDSYRVGAATSRLILYLNSFLNPFIYPFAGTGFKKHLPSCRCLTTPRQRVAGARHRYPSQCASSQQPETTPTSSCHQTDSTFTNKKDENTWI